MAYLTNALLSGEIPAGSRLPPERALAERFNLSRPMVREVLKSMTERGLIDAQAGRGNFARALTIVDGARPLDYYYRRTATAREVTDARILLETELCARAAVHMTPPELERLATALQRFDEATSVVERARWDITFHSLIARGARNSVLEAMFFSIARLTFVYMIRSLSDPKVDRKGSPFHADILTALREHDAPAAAAAMTGHLSVARDHYGADLDQSVTGLATRELGRLLGPDFSLADLIDNVLSPLADTPVDAIDLDR